MLGLFVVLVPMLLLSAVFVHLNVIQLEAADHQTEPKSKEDLDLSVTIEQASYVVSARGNPPKRIPAGQDALTHLRRKLAEIHREHADTRALKIVSQPETTYETVIAVMDVSRESGFPGISLASGGS